MPELQGPWKVMNLTHVKGCIHILHMHYIKDKVVWLWCTCTCIQNLNGNVKTVAAYVSQQKCWQIM